MKRYLCWNEHHELLLPLHCGSEAVVVGFQHRCCCLAQVVDDDPMMQTRDLRRQVVGCESDSRSSVRGRTVAVMYPWSWSWYLKMCNEERRLERRDKFL